MPRNWISKGDAVGVSGVEFQRILFEIIHDHEQGIPLEQWEPWEGSHGARLRLSGRQFLLETLELPVGTLDSWLNRKKPPKWLPFSVVDPVLAKLDKSHLLAPGFPGGLTLVPNPRWSQERWEQWAEENGWC